MTVYHLICYGKNYYGPIKIIGKWFHVLAISFLYYYKERYNSFVYLTEKGLEYVLDEHMNRIDVRDLIKSIYNLSIETFSEKRENIIDDVCHYTIGEPCEIFNEESYYGTSLYIELDEYTYLDICFVEKMYENEDLVYQGKTESLDDIMRNKIVVTLNLYEDVKFESSIEYFYQLERYEKISDLIKRLER